MGTRGPVPNREDDLARKRSRKGGENTEVTKGTMRPVGTLEPDPEWHPIARTLWDSLSTSGQSDFYQNSDWAFAYSICEDLSYYKNAPHGKRSGQMLQTIYAAMSNLLVTEADRRRVRIELEELPQETGDATLHVIHGYAEELGLSPDEL